MPGAAPAISPAVGEQHSPGRSPTVSNVGWGRGRGTGLYEWTTQQRGAASRRAPENCCPSQFADPAIRSTDAWDADASVARANSHPRVRSLQRWPKDEANRLAPGNRHPARTGNGPGAHRPGFGRQDARAVPYGSCGIDTGYRKATSSRSQPRQLATDALADSGVGVDPYEDRGAPPIEPSPSELTPAPRDLPADLAVTLSHRRREFLTGDRHLPNARE